MTLGEFGSAQNIQGMLVNLGKDALTDLLSDYIFGGSDEVDGRPSLLEVLLAQLIRSFSPSAIAGGPSGGGGGASQMQAASTGGKTHAHHTVPEYMCGAANQFDLVNLDVGDHVTLHAQMRAFDAALTLAGLALTKAFRYKKGKRVRKGTAPENFSPVNLVAKTKGGRAAIATALGEFYWEMGWALEGVGVKTGLPIGLVLGGETLPYVRNNHQYSATVPCKKY